jgi:hypothetical protein
MFIHVKYLLYAIIIILLLEYSNTFKMATEIRLYAGYLKLNKYSDDNVIISGFDILNNKIKFILLIQT